MIRINLKRSNSSGGPSTSRKILGIEFNPSKFLTKLSIDFNALVILTTASAIAGLPHIIVSQYEVVMEEQNEKAVKRVENSIRSLNQEIEKFIPFQKELESYDKQKESVKTRLAVVESLIASRGTPVSLLNAFGQSLPQRTWISNLDLTLEGKGAGIKISGMSFSNEEISDLMDKLSESIYFSDVKLDEVTSGKTPDGRLDVRNFKMSAKTKGAALKTEAATIPESKSKT